MLLFWDYLILAISLISSVMWVILWTNTLYKIYFWMIFGFLFFLVFNLQINVLELKRPEKLTFLQDFLMKNKAFCLWWASISIFLIWFSFTIWSEKKESNIFSSLILWFFLFIFYIWINSYILTTSVIKLDFLESIFSIIKLSSIYNIFIQNPHYIFLLMIFVLFWKIINLLLMWFGWYLLEVSKAAFWNIKERQWEINEMQEELDEESRKKRLFW